MQYDIAHINVYLEGKRYLDQHKKFLEQYRSHEVNMILTCKVPLLLS